MSEETKEETKPLYQPGQIGDGMLSAVNGILDRFSDLENRLKKVEGLKVANVLEDDEYRTLGKAIIHTFHDYEPLQEALKEQIKEHSSEVDMDEVHSEAERAAERCMDNYDFSGAMEAAVRDLDMHDYVDDIAEEKAQEAAKEVVSTYTEGMEARIRKLEEGMKPAKEEEKPKEEEEDSREPANLRAAIKELKARALASPSKRTVRLVKYIESTLGFD